MRPSILFLLAPFVSVAATACREPSCCQNRRSCDECPCPTAQAPIPDAPSSPITVNSTNVNNNNFTSPTDIHIENVVRTQNTLMIPINVTVENTNVVNVRSEPTFPELNSTSAVPVPYPVPIFVQVPAGCCKVIQPCVPYGCPWLRQTQCGSTCRSRFMFEPIDPCQGSCSRTERSMQSWCLGPNFCRQLPIDCSTCPENFYSDYSTFARCGGCFRPSGWLEDGEDMVGWPNLRWLVGGSPSGMNATGKVRVA